MSHAAARSRCDVGAKRRSGSPACPAMPASPPRLCRWPGRTPAPRWRGPPPPGAPAGRRGAGRRSPAAPSRRRRASWAPGSAAAAAQASRASSSSCSRSSASAGTGAPPSPMHPQPQLGMAAHVHLQHVGAPLGELRHGVGAVGRRRLHGMLVDETVASARQRQGEHRAPPARRSAAPAPPAPTWWPRAGRSSPRRPRPANAGADRSGWPRQLLAESSRSTRADRPLAIDHAVAGPGAHALQPLVQAAGCRAGAPAPRSGRRLKGLGDGLHLPVAEVAGEEEARPCPCAWHEPRARRPPTRSGAASRPATGVPNLQQLEQQRRRSARTCRLQRAPFGGSARGKRVRQVLPRDAAVKAVHRMDTGGPGRAAPARGGHRHRAHGGRDGASPGPSRLRTAPSSSTRHQLPATWCGARAAAMRCRSHSRNWPAGSIAARSGTVHPRDTRRWQARQAHKVLLGGHAPPPHAPRLRPHPPAPRPRP